MSVTEQLLMTMKSGVSPFEARLIPALAKICATVDVSAKLSLHPKVWKRADELSNILLSVILSELEIYEWGHVFATQFEHKLHHNYEYD